MMDTEMTPLLRSAATLQRLLTLASIGFAGLAVGMLIRLMVDPHSIGETVASNIGYGGSELHLWQSIALVALVLTQLCIWSGVLWRGRQVFEALTNGALQTASHSAKRLARMLWIMLVWSILAHTLGTIIATWEYPEGQRALSVSFGSAQISTLIAALLASFTAHAFVVGAALWQDHNEVI